MAYYAPFYQPTYYNTNQARQEMPQYNQQYQQPMQTVQQPMQQPVQTPQNNNGLIWVQGEAGAKSYLVAPNTTVMLMDSEGDRFYLKSADASGMPMPLRTFEYRETNEPNCKASSGVTNGFDKLDDRFVTREEFEQRMASMASQCQCKNKTKKVKEEIEDGEQLTL